jgi:hypothetical protein
MSAIVTLIPAYKPEYLGDLFVGLRSQKFKDFRVVLSDDSPGGEITERIRGEMYGNLAQELNLLVVRGPCQGAHKNVQHLIANWGSSAAWVHVHLDDDVIYPDFYRAHMAAHASGPFSASVSLRWVTSPDGRPAQDLPLPEFLDKESSHIVPVASEKLFSTTIPTCENWLGELSNVVLHRDAAARYLDSRIGTYSYYGLGDIGLLLDASRETALAVIRDHLSGFRSHPQQTSVQLQSFPLKCGHLAWMSLCLAAWREGRVSPHQAGKSLGIALRRSAHLYADDAEIEPFFSLIESHAHDLDSLANAFNARWTAFLESHPYSSSWNPKSKFQIPR